MPSQSNSDATTANKWSEVDSTSSDSYEYTICLLGDWAHMRTTKATQLSSPSTETSSTPVAVHEISVEVESPIVQVSCGSGWSCLLCEDGRAFSFGDNTYGQLGQGHNRPYVGVPMSLSSPFCLQPRRQILRLSCGHTHGGFVLDSGELYMFGCGSYGRLGTGNEENTSVPTVIHMKWSTLLAAAPGSTNHRKQQNSVVITEVEDEVHFTDVSCGDRHTLALAVRTVGGSTDSRRTTKTIKSGIISFGDGMNGRLGLGDAKDRYEGALVTTWHAASNVLGSGIAGNNGCMTPPTITAICAGSTHNLALSASGDVFSWGNGVDGQLGHGVRVSEWVPRQLAFFKNLSVTSVSCGVSHSVAISRTGVVYTWGQGTDGQLGLDLEADSSVDVVDKSVWVPHPVGILKGSTHRVTIRTIAAKQNISLALDDRDRMFVWGDNSFEQLGLPLAASVEVGTKSYVPKPRLLAYMDLHAPKTAICGPPSSLSRVSSLRELVAAAKPDPIRLGLVHIDTGDRFTMLVFRTKPGISSSNNTSGDSRKPKSRASPEVSPDTKVDAASVSKWNFSLTDELPASAIPSREPAYYQFMVNYKVYIRPTITKSRDEAEESDNELQRRSPRRREHPRSSACQRGSLLPNSNLASPNHGSSTNNQVLFGDTASSSPAHVQGFDSWLDKRLNSPSKSYLAGHSFPNAPRFPSPSKEDETRSTTSTTTRKENNKSRVSKLSMKPQKPRSGFGRTLSARRPTAFLSEPLNKKAISVSNSNSPSKQSNNQEHSPRQSPAKPFIVVPFGSSVESRFGPSPRSTTPSTPIYPEKSSIRERRAPQFTMAGAEHFSLIISRRLHQAKGSGPGPGTYDRHGG